MSVVGIRGLKVRLIYDHNNNNNTTQHNTTHEINNMEGDIPVTLGHLAHDHDVAALGLTAGNEECDLAESDTTTENDDNTVPPPPKVTLPPSPGADVDDRADDADEEVDGGAKMSHWWATSMSNAALLAVHTINRMDDISKLSVQHDYSIKDGSIKRRIEIDFLNRDSSIVRMSAPYL